MNMQELLWAGAFCCCFGAVAQTFDQNTDILWKMPHPAGMEEASLLESNKAPLKDEAGLENLALRPGAVTTASSSLKGYAIHAVPHLRDGLLGNDHSWVAGQETGWAAIDLGGVFSICRVAIGSDSVNKFRDRAPTFFEIQVQASRSAPWQTVVKYAGDPVSLRRLWTFRPVRAAGVRVAIHASNGGEPRLEEIEVYGSEKDIAPEQVGNVSPSTDVCPQEEDLQHKAILGEEHATLKAAGYADVARWLRDTIYPEQHGPRHCDDDVLPLAKLPAAPSLDGTGNDPAWLRCSRGTARVARIGFWAEGPLVEQSAEAGIFGDKLYLAVSATHFLSSSLAAVYTLGGQRPVAGLIRWTQGNLVWQTVPDGKPVALSGVFNKAGNWLETALPLAWLPEAQTAGIAVGLGMGGRWAPPGGRPVNFLPASFSVRQKGGLEDDSFILQLHFDEAHPNLTLEADSDPVRLRLPYRLLEGEELLFRVQAKAGDAGRTANVRIADGRGRVWKLGCLRYQPAAAALARYRDMIDRRESAGEDLHADRRQALAFAERLEKVSTAEPSVAERTLLWDVSQAKRKLALGDPQLQSLKGLLFSKRHPFRPSHNYSVQFDSPWQPGGAVCRAEIPNESGRLAPAKITVTNIAEAGDGIIRDPSVSFDAKTCYYAWRESRTNYYRIWSQDLATGVRRRVSPEGPFHDFWPTPLPDGGLAMISTRCKRKFICWRPQAAVLFRMQPDGSAVKPLSFANLTEFAPSVLDDGRILWTRSEYADKGADYGHTLWTIRDDGTYPELVFGNTIGAPQGFANGRFVPGRRAVCAIMISHFGDLNGPVAWIDQTKSPHDPTAIRSLTPEVPWPGFPAYSEIFREPYPVSSDWMLVSWAPQDRFGIFLMDCYGNRELLYMDPDIDSICAQPLAARPVPPVRNGALVPALAKQEKGQLSIENVYRGLEGSVKPGAAKWLRICQELPTPLKKLPDGSYQADHDPFESYYASPTDLLRSLPFGWPSYIAKGVIGTVPVEADGSANFTVPAGKVIYFQLLDKDFNEIQRMRSVMQLQAGEQRSCIGCHESRLITPTKDYLKRQALQKPSVTPEPPPWGAGPFWFERVVQPVLDKRCVSCHNAKAPNKCDLTDVRDKDNIPASYRNLLQTGTIHYFTYQWQQGVPYKAAPYSFGTAKSRLWAILRDKNHASFTLTPHEEQAIKCWTDLNVPLWGDYTFRPERKTFRPQDSGRWIPD